MHLAIHMTLYCPVHWRCTLHSRVKKTRHYPLVISLSELREISVKIKHVEWPRNACMHALMHEGMANTSLLRENKIE